MTNENLPLSSLPKCNIIAQKDLLNLSSDKRQRIDFEIEQALLLSKASLEEQITALYGSAYNNDHHTIVNTAATTSGIDSHTTATVGVFWGRGNRRNQASRIPGKQTANRAQLYAILLAITDANPCHALHIISPSEYAIHSICHWAPKLARAGWPCANKDILCDLHTRISSFHSHILFSLTNRQSDNPNHRQAITLARNALTIHHSPVTTLPTKTHMCTCVSPELPILKVSTTLRIRSIAETKLIELDVLPSAPSPTDLMKRDHLSALLRSSSDKMFWSAVNKMSIPVPKRSDINAEDLLPIFAERMNPPTILPPTFNSTRRSLNTLLYNSISSSTENPLQSHDAFTRPFSIPEIEQIKAHIIRHNVHSARGPDSVSYEDLLCIPNDTLTDIFNSCIAQQVMPVSWCNAFIAARPKKGSVQNDPNSFRTIGLESCMLKMITLLIDRRLRIWAKEKEIIPPSQNGFQDKLRTINNVFILRCVLDKTRAYNQPLHIVFIDLTNAFPSVHQPTLWIKLRRLGADGPMIRWIQLLYESLRYQVRFQGSFSILFRALAGILIGDPASPFFWIFYMQDLRISSHSDDVILHNTPISHLEQADDIVLFSTSQEAIQGKLQELSIWCSDNGMAINPKKSAHLYFAPRGKRSEDASSLWVDNMELPKTTSYNYLGVSWSTTSTTSFTDHLKEKTKKATNMTNAIFGIESFTDQMPPTALRSLYYARVDPHLTSAREPPMLVLGFTASARHHRYHLIPNGPPHQRDVPTARARYSEQYRDGAIYPNNKLQQACTSIRMQKILPTTHQFP
ncbi:hypothetical protein NLI96_g1734 [Meripilus lineatus]|uniref:Reverse transcriptase domain-containing protein n=1 Tax=Meripilus lineatus TaxID=2056292 RepID=A0AAD5YKN4_9APHY|nr:hypothetical protein NLI96_g1734 [Physisporinus lineatus]